MLVEPCSAAVPERRVASPPAGAPSPYRLASPAKGPLPVNRLAALVTAVAGADSEWRHLVRHDSRQRWYVRLHRTDAAELWLLGWDTGQDTLLHDHGGSAGAYTVVEGILTDDSTTRRRRGQLRRRRVPAGAVVTFGPSYLHNLGNEGPGVATSIHAYSPPLSVMRFYTLGDDGLPVRSGSVEVQGPEPGLPAAVSDGRLMTTGGRA